MYSGKKSAETFPKPPFSSCLPPRAGGFDNIVPVQQVCYLGVSYSSPSDLLDDLHDVFVVEAVIFTRLHRLVLHARAPDPRVLEVRQNVLHTEPSHHTGRHAEVGDGRRQDGRTDGRTGREQEARFVRLYNDFHGHKKC